MRTYPVNIRCGKKREYPENTHDLTDVYVMQVSEVNMFFISQTKNSSKFRKIAKKRLLINKEIKKGGNFNFQSHMVSKCDFTLTMLN